MRLYSVPLSPFAARVRLSIYRKGLDRIEIVPPPRDGLSSPAYLALNPMAQVPTLVLDTGVAIPDSAVILEYLEDAFPEPSLRPRDPAALARARLLMRLPDQHFANAPRTLLGMRDPARRDPAAMAAAFDQMIRGLGHIDHYLDGGPWAVGDAPSIADSALIPVLNAVALIERTFGRSDLLSERPRLASYWRAASEEPVHARVIGEQLAAVPAR